MRNRLLTAPWRAGLAGLCAVLGLVVAVATWLFRHLHRVRRPQLFGPRYLMP